MRGIWPYIPMLWFRNKEEKGFWLKELRRQQAAVAKQVKSPGRKSNTIPNNTSAKPKGSWPRKH